MSKHLKIDIVSDVSCPWCVIGYQSLAGALDRLAPEISARIAWKPFELNPRMPVAGQLLREHLHEKYGSSAADTEQTSNMITARGAALGFQFCFKENGRIYNTFNAHRLLYWARSFDKQTELALALFKLYFTEGGNPGNPEELIQTVGKTGLSKEDAKKILGSDQYVTEVREEEARYLAMGITSVPTFIINDKYKINGGQPVAAFVDALNKIAAEETLLNK